LLAKGGPFHGVLFKVFEQEDGLVGSYSFVVVVVVVVSFFWYLHCHQWEYLYLHPYRCHLSLCPYSLVLVGIAGVFEHGLRVLGQIKHFKQADRGLGVVIIVAIAVIQCWHLRCCWLHPLSRH
jgi:hypothetical protein